MQYVFVDRTDEIEMGGNIMALCREVTGDRQAMPGEWVGGWNYSCEYPGASGLSKRLIV